MGSRSDGWKQPFIASSKTSVITVVSSANLHGRWSAAGGAWRRRICLLLRVDIHILFRRFRRDWRPYRLYSTENEVISSVQQSASRSQRKSKNYFLTSVMIANHGDQHGKLRDTKCRPVRRYSGMSVLLSEKKVQVSWPKFVQDVFTLTYNRVHLIFRLHSQGGQFQISPAASPEISHQMVCS